MSAFLSHAGDPATYVVGALPFDPEAPAHLYAPGDVLRAPTAISAALTAPHAPPHDGPVGIWRVTAEPSRAGYARAVAAALAQLAQSEAAAGAGIAMRKVVLARRLTLHGHAGIDVDAVVARLRADPSVTTFCVPLPDDTDAEGTPTPRALVGATPELLVERVGRRVASCPLAGSARRHPEAAADQTAARTLADSAKDLREHAVVVESIADLLAPYCRHLCVPSTPSLVSTASMWHLGTRIEGELHGDDASAVELAAALHPTPAVCGLPREPARAAIAELEPFDRGFYAGTVGWCDARGDGRWLVAIRCAEVAGTTARLYAGAGIVPGSDPSAEAAETAAKFTAMLRALGVETGRHALDEEQR